MLVGILKTVIESVDTNPPIAPYLIASLGAERSASDPRSAVVSSRDREVLAVFPVTESSIESGTVSFSLGIGLSFLTCSISMDEIWKYVVLFGYIGSLKLKRPGILTSRRRMSHRNYRMRELELSLSDEPFVADPAGFPLAIRR